MAPRAVTALARRTMCASSASTCLKTRAKIKLNQMKGEMLNNSETHAISTTPGT
jgi:hypothetical protein